MGRCPRSVGCPGTSPGSSSVGSPSRRGSSAVRCNRTQAVNVDPRFTNNGGLRVNSPPRAVEVAVLLVDITTDDLVSLPAQRDQTRFYHPVLYLSLAALWGGMMISHLNVARRRPRDDPVACAESRGLWVAHPADASSFRDHRCVDPAVERRVCEAKHLLLRVGERQRGLLEAGLCEFLRAGGAKAVLICTHKQVVLEPVGCTVASATKKGRTGVLVVSSQPPPWFAVSWNRTVASAPRFQTVPVGRGLSTTYARQ